MALQTAAFARQLLSSYHVGTLTDTNATIALQQSNGVLYAARAEMLYAEQASEESVSWLVSD
jgi:hypothetical protein